MARAFQNLSLILAAAAVGCLPPKSKGGGSSGKSLDNLARTASGQEAKNNHCGVDYTSDDALPDHTKVAVKENRVDALAEWRGEVLGTLAAAPVGLLRVFINRGGVIQVAKNMSEAESLCSGAPLSDQERAVGAIKVQSCWLSSPRATIVLAPDKTRIRSDLIRQLSFYFTEHFVDAAEKSDNAEAQAFAKSFEEKRDKLETAFLMDLQTSNPDAWLKLTTSLEQSRRANLIFGEAVDSYYCSAASRDVFQTKFKGAWDEFTDEKSAFSAVSLFDK